MSREERDYVSAFLKLLGPAVVDETEAEIRRRLSDDAFAWILTAYLAETAADLLEEQTGVRISELAPPVGEIRLALTGFEGSRDRYRVLAQKVAVRMHRSILAALGQDESVVESGLFHYKEAERRFVELFGREKFETLFEVCLDTAIRVFAYAFLKCQGPDFLVPRALEYLVGARAEPDYFLVSQIDIALRRGEVEYAELLCADPGILNFRDQNGEPLHHSPASYRSKTTSLDLNEQRIVYAVGEALCASKWTAADKPLPYVVSATWNILRDRSKVHDRERIKSRKYGLVLTPLDDSHSRALEDPTSSEAQIQTELHNQRLLSRLEPDLSAFVGLKMQGYVVEEMPQLLGMELKRVRAIERRWNRLTQKHRKSDRN